MKIFEHKPNLTEKDIKKGLRMYVMDGVCSMSTASVQSGVYLTAFALAMGATQKQIGLIASIAFLSQLMQLPGLLLVTKYPKRKLITVLSATVSRFFWIFIILIPFYAANNVNLLLLLLLIAALIGAIPGPAWNSLLRDLLPIQNLGSINSKRIFISTTFALVLTLIGGYFVDWWKINYSNQQIFSYSILFGLGLVFGIAGITAILQIPESKSTASKVPLKELLTAPIKDKNFRMLMIFLAIWTFAVNMSSPFFLVYMLNRIEISLFMVTILVVTNQLSNILFLKIWGKLADKFSNKSVLTISCPLFIIAIILWTFTSMPEPHNFTIPLLFIIHILIGIAQSGVTIGTANIALKLSPQGKAHGYMTMVGLSSSVMGAIAPITGGILADYFSKIQLDLPLILKVNTEQYSLPLLNFKGLDFLFLLTFIIGFYAIHRLALVKEYGEADRKLVMDELTESIVMPIKSLSLWTGAGKIAVMPISGMMHLAEKVSQKKKKKNKDIPSKKTRKS